MYQTLKTEIISLVEETDHLATLITECHKVVCSIPEEPLKKVFAEETLIFIQDYKRLSKELEEKLLLLFEAERVEKHPIDLNFRKLYKILIKERF